MGKIKYQPTVFADPLADALAEPPVNAQVYDDGARVRCKKFIKTLTADLVVADTLALCLLPKNARVIRGALDFEAMGTGATIDLGLVGADASGEIEDGVADDPDMLLDGVVVAAAGQDTFAVLENGDASALYLTQKDVLLLATAGVADWPSGQTIRGYVLYVVD